MYVFCCSYAHNVAASNRWVAFVSTTVESSNPEAELAPGLALLGHIDAKFVSVVDVHEPLTDGSRCVLTVIKACVAACGAMVHGPLVIYIRCMYLSPIPTLLLPVMPPTSARAITPAHTLRPSWRLCWTCTAASLGRLSLINNLRCRTIERCRSRVSGCPV